MRGSVAMTDLSASIQNHKESLLFKPDDYKRFICYLSGITSEQALFSRLTYWMVFRGSANDQTDRLNMVRERAKELNLWNGLELKIERWKQEVATEFDQMGEESFTAAVGDDYANWFNALPDSKTPKTPALEAFSAKELSEMVLPPPRFIIDKLIPFGLGLLVAKPKIGKSWFVLDLCLSVATGEPFLGYRTNQRGTLYLALEDGKARAKDRILKVLNGKPVPDAARIIFKAPRMDEGLLDELGKFLDDNPDIHLICIDTLSKVRPQEKAFDNAYSADYRFMGALKDFADSRGLCILLVHHTSKRRVDDSFESINGSTGIMGASDFSMILNKPDRSEDNATLSITGRDIEQQEQVIQFNKECFRWTMQGSAAEIAEQRAVAEYEASPIVKTLRELLLQGDGTWTGNSKELMQMGERYANAELAPTSQALANAIAELEPLLWDRDAIKHTVHSNGSGGKRHSFKMFRTDNVNEIEESEQIPLM